MSAATAWRASASRQGSLFQSSRTYEQLPALTVEESGGEVDIPADVLASGPRGVHELTTGEPPEIPPCASARALPSAEGAAVYRVVGQGSSP